VYVFDASSVVNLIRRGIIKPLGEGLTLDLAVYESLNAVWKECKVLRRINEKLALRYIEILAELFKIMELTSVKNHEKEVFKLALNEGLTVYDAAYLYTAITRNATLVTDDENLRRKASKHVKTLKSTDLAQQHS